MSVKNGLSATNIALPPTVQPSQLNTVLKLLEITRDPLPIHTAAGRFLAAQVFADPSGNIVFRGVGKPRPVDDTIIDDDDVREQTYPYVEIVVNNGLIWKGAQCRFSCVRRFRPGVELFVEFRVTPDPLKPNDTVVDAAISLMVPLAEAADTVAASILSEEQLAAAVSQLRNSK